MFLDEVLLEMCKTYDYTQKVSTLYTQLCDKCQEYYQSKISPFMPKKDVKVILDRTFNLWDSFTRMAIKDDNVNVRIMGEICKNFTFKETFMDVPELKELYDSL